MASIKVWKAFFYAFYDEDHRRACSGITTGESAVDVAVEVSGNFGNIRFLTVKALPDLLGLEMENETVFVRAGSGESVDVPDELPGGMPEAVDELPGGMPGAGESAELPGGMPEAVELASKGDLAGMPDEAMQRSLPRAIAVDFDGCLCDNRWPEIGREHKRVLNRLRVAKAQGAKLILWTCREGKLLEDAIAWCREREIVFDAVNANLPERIQAYGGNPRKVSADEYWDDKAWRVDG